MARVQDRLFMPERWVSILGQTYVKHEHAPILTIGPRMWDRWHLGRLGCPHPVAAASLNRVVTELRITSLGALAKQLHEIGLYKGIGTTAYALALAVLQEGGYNLTDVHGEEITYTTMKVRARTAAAKAQKQRKRPRRAGPPSEAKDMTT